MTEGKNIPSTPKKKGPSYAYFNKDASIARQRGSEIEFNSLVDSIEENQARTYAISNNIPYIGLTRKFIPIETLLLVDNEFIEKYNLIPFHDDMGVIYLATTNPNLDSELILEGQKVFTEKTERKTRVFFTSKAGFALAYKQFQNIPKQERAETKFTVSEEDGRSARENLANYSELREKIKKVPAVEILRVILAGAVANKASDIHIESEEKYIRVRYRVDGILNEIVRLPVEIGSQLATQIKIASKIELARTKKPQDGRFNIETFDRRVDLRVSVLPTQFGESIVIRLLDWSASSLPIEEIGLEGEALEIVRREISKPLGMILITGPTGSGKTSTLYSILAKLNQPGVKIITLENPIEYRLEGVSQSQVEDAGTSDAQDLAKAIRGEAVGDRYTFASGLRAVMRQDPDIILVGEIRDLETADTAIQAALTGHLVLSTFHANDVATAIPRLVQMGVKPFFLQIALNILMSQRLIRKNCPHCTVEYEPANDEWNEIIKTLEEAPKEFLESNRIDLARKPILKKGSGCDFCNNTGFKGRTGIFEVLGIGKKMREAITAAETVGEVYKVLMNAGFVTMEQDGLKKALVDKITTPQEVWRVVKI